MTIAFELDHPFDKGGENYARLEARRPKVRDLNQFLKDVDKDASSAMEKVLANLCEVHPSVIAEVDIEDYAKMKRWFEDFLKPMMAE